jgi:hypothetical protein
MSEIRKWLETNGLGQYADAFEANEIDMDLLGQVDDQILKDIGVSAAGHRLRIRMPSPRWVQPLRPTQKQLLPAVHPRCLRPPLSAANLQ